MVGNWLMALNSDIAASQPAPYLAQRSCCLRYVHLYCSLANNPSNNLTNINGPVLGHLSRAIRPHATKQRYCWGLPFLYIGAWQPRTKINRSPMKSLPAKSVNPCSSSSAKSSTANSYTIQSIKYINLKHVSTNS